ncbi:hypothetical protein LIPSTDRAFT_225261 [Lipomyces starkeyi NRRL Y-11557]|uniref:Uncharacterized protein n=1 Tax=Lipomyces starkeyi NRRL Y-11557 TaxID=675824 RepID=A0A1E3PU87_LIPST|nr:hypothetical protein LIPSTDRAFT_225261 [Lipomyces starkeyi NRRL Y-11557]
MSPFRVMYGYDPEFYVDVADDVPAGEIPAAKDRIKKLHELRMTLRDQLLKSRKDRRSITTRDTCRLSLREAPL